mgnify:CR=1 FL=1
MGLIHAGLAQHGSAVLAATQTAGKGQRGKKWESPPAESLNLSVIVKPQFLQPRQAFELLATVAVSVEQCLEKYIGDEARIKWPNDLYWRDRKAGGILIESQVQGQQWNWAVIGIGINVLQQQFPSFLPNPVSIRQICGKEILISDLATDIRNNIIDSLELLNRNGFSAFFQQYNEKLFHLNEMATLQQQNRRFTTRIKGVNEQGQLVAGEHSELQFDFGTIEWIL